MVIGTGSHENLEAGILRGEPFKKSTHFLFRKCVREVILPLVDEIRRHIGIETVQ